ncbi:MAG: STAS domain-containing protein [Spirochaetales bacterium]|nr:STAS domain-containing protein [Spirochaetales bacterium]
MNTNVMKILTIENAAAAANELLKSLKSKKDIVLDLSMVDRVDLSGIQLLISVQNTGEEQNESFFYTGTLNKAVFDKISNNGFCFIPKEEDSELFTIRRSSGEF